MSQSTAPTDPAGQGRTTPESAAPARWYDRVFHRSGQDTRPGSAGRRDDTDRRGDATVPVNPVNPTDRGEGRGRAAGVATAPRPDATDPAAPESPRDPRPVEVVEPAPVVPRAHTSWAAVLGLVLGVTAVYAALTVELSTVAVVLGFLGVLLAAVGMSSARRRRVASGPLATLALLVSLGGVALGALAISGDVSWLTGDDRVGQFTEWLDRNAPWLTELSD